MTFSQYVPEFYQPKQIPPLEEVKYYFQINMHRLEYLLIYHLLLPLVFCQFGLRVRIPASRSDGIRFNSRRCVIQKLKLSTGSLLVRVLNQGGGMPLYGRTVIAMKPDINKLM